MKTLKLTDDSWNNLEIYEDELDGKIVCAITMITDGGSYTYWIDNTSDMNSFTNWANNINDKLKVN